MNCNEWEERIALHASGDLSPDEAVPVERHLSACADCRGFIEELREDLRLLRLAHAQPIAEAHFTAVRARVLERLNVTRRPWWRGRWVYGLAALAAVLAIVMATRSKQIPAGVAPDQASVAPVQAAPVQAPRATPPPATVRRPRPSRLLASSASGLRHAEPMVVKLMTNDPDVVIYWIADK